MTIIDTVDDLDDIYNVDDVNKVPLAMISHTNLSSTFYHKLVVGWSVLVSVEYINLRQYLIIAN